MVGIRFHQVGFSISVCVGKKIISTEFVFYMGNNKTSSESFRTVSRGPLLRTCRGTRVGRYNNNNNRTSDRYTRYMYKLFRTVRLTTMVVAVNFLI